MYYLRQLEKMLSHMDLDIVARGKVPLAEIYAEAPSTTTLSVEIAHGRPSRWAARDADPITEQRFNTLLRQSEPAQLTKLINHIQTEIDASTSLPLDDLRARPLPLSPLYADGLKTRRIYRSTRVSHLNFSRLVITGPPGSGKTTLARHLALEVAAERHRSLTTQTSHREDSVVSSRLPVYIEFRPFVDFAGWPDHGVRNITSDDLSRYVRHAYIPHGTVEDASAFNRALVAGESVLIFDGLDQVRLPATDDGIKHRRDQLAYFLDIVERDFSPDCIVVTSRDYAYSDWSLPRFDRASFGSFAVGDTFLLARRLLLYAHGAQTPTLDRDTKALVEQMFHLLPEHLRSRPLFITLLVGIYLRRLAGGKVGLPARPSDLYEESVDLFLDRWTCRPGDNLLERLGCDVGQLHERLESIAYVGQGSDAANVRPSESGQDQTFGENLLLNELVSLPGRVNYHEIVGYLNREAGLIVSPSPRQYRFAHRSFQEHLAACYLCRFHAGSVQWEAIRNNVAHAPGAWREVHRMLGILLVERGRMDELWDLVDSLIVDNPDGAAGDDATVVWPLWLAGTYVDELILNGSRIGRRQRLVIDDLVHAIEATQFKPGPLALTERCQLWNTRGRVRATVADRQVLPAISWCRIPAGPFRMGLTDDECTTIRSFTHPGSWLPGREVPAHSVVLPAYLISRYPVTRFEFRGFRLGFRRLLPRRQLEAESSAVSPRRRAVDPCRSKG